VAEEHHRSGRGQPSSENEGTTAGQDELAQQLSELSRSLQAQDTTDLMLDELVRAAVAVIPGVDEGSISVVTGRSAITSQSPSGDLPRRVDAVQAELGEGPCLDAVFHQQTVQVPDMAHEQRWPRFAAAAAEAGAASMLSFQLYVEKDNLGALNLYSYRPHAFDDESEHVGLMFASHAAVAFADTQRIDQLNHKAETRDLIGQAKGILMERYNISSDRAFAVLVRISQHNNRRLRDVAEELVSTRQLSDLEQRPADAAT
jgi:transcriptional regulator with GAF, ATPase, and Fis domain